MFKEMRKWYVVNATTGKIIAERWSKSEAYRVMRTLKTRYPYRNFTVEQD